MAVRVHAVVRELRGYPRQYWILVAGTFVYVGAAALGFPYEAIFLRRTLGASLSWIGILFGVVPLVVMPLQVWGGALTDRIGRRWMISAAAVSAVVWFVGFAYSQTLWQVGVLVALESVLGWPLYQTASSAMIADLIPPERRAEAFSISRVAMNAGVVAGPALGGLALGAGLSFRQLFLVAAGGCFVFLIVTLFGIRETRPESAVRQQDDDAPHGYRIVLADRRFLAFCGISLLPVSLFGTFTSMYPVFITDTIGVPYKTWGLLLALNAAMVAIVQFPLVRGLRSADKLVLMAVASVLIGLALGLTAFVYSLWPLVMFVILMSFGEMLLSPIATTMVSDMAPEEVRGRYMGVWALIWNGGMGLGPALAGVSMDGLGSRQTFSAMIVFGAVGAVGYLLLRAAIRRRDQAGPGARDGVPLDEV